jgi:CheY-like chemotaxis protein
MGGRISVTSRLGEGSCFAVEIPATAVSETADDSRSGFNVDALLGARVLVVDDNAANRELVKATLSVLGAEPFEAADGRSAIALSLTQPVDVILMDINMPGMSGIEALRQIRQGRGPNSDIPAYAFTANVLPDDVAALVRHGFEGHLSKPIEMAKLVNAVSSALSAPIEAEPGTAAHG